MLTGGVDWLQNLDALKESVKLAGSTKWDDKNLTQFQGIYCIDKHYNTQSLVHKCHTIGFIKITCTSHTGIKRCMLQYSKCCSCTLTIEVHCVNADLGGRQTRAL